MIVPMTEAHIGAVARLHRDGLTGLVSGLGLPAVRAFYAGALRTGAAVAFVAIDDGVVRGFVLGSAHPGRMRREAFRRNAARTLWGLALGIARRPSSLVHLVKSFGGPDEGRYDPDAAELTYLAVAAGSRGTGIGRRLVAAFTDALRQAGITAYEISVDDDNRDAIRFYERLGFRGLGTYREFGRVHRRYRHE